MEIWTVEPINTYGGEMYHIAYIFLTIVAQGSQVSLRISGLFHTLDWFYILTVFLIRAI